MNKSYDINDESSKSKRINKDFNLFGVNLNISKEEQQDDIIKYGRTCHNKVFNTKK